MAEFNDPRMPNYGRANYGQLAPNNSSAFAQPQKPVSTPNTSPMMLSLQKAPQQPAPTPPQTGMNMAATGTFGPKTNPFAGLKQRKQTDFGKGGWQGGFNAVGSALNVKSPFGAALGIQRRAKGSGNDYSVQDANTILQRGYQDAFGRQATPDELQSQLAGQGLKQGDRWVGQKGLDAVLASLRQQPQVPTQGTDAPINELGPTIPEASPMSAALQPTQSTGAQQAYQEYLSEFAPDEQEQPVPFEQFSQFFDQMPQQSPMASAVGEGRRGWENLNLDMMGEQASPMGLNGFNTERAFAGGDPNSVKDAFARAMSTYPVDLRGKSKEEVGAHLASPEYHAHLASQGIQSRPIPGAYDQIEVFTKENGWETRDVVSNAGSPDAQWWWGDVGGMDATDPMMGLDLGDDTEGLTAGTNVSPMLGGLGGQNWKSLLETLMRQQMEG